ncbi:MAG: hypothetical protein LC687_05570 [Actinobacteria bacterium]|nr:hypothetical protein [Actinomycetota bacterium]
MQKRSQAVVVALPVRQPLTGEKAIKKVRALWDEGKYTWSRFAHDAGIDELDVNRVICDGAVVGRPRATGDGTFAYKVVAAKIDGKHPFFWIEISGRSLVVHYESFCGVE